MPSTRALVAAGLATLAAAVAVAAPSLGWAAVLADLAIVLAVLADSVRASRLPLAAERVWPPLLVQGASGEVELRMKSPRGVTLVLREALHPALSESPLRQQMELPWGGEGVWRYVLRPRRRGEHEVGPLTVRVLGPWGFGWAQRELLPREKRRVYPQTRFEGRVGRLLALAQRKELGWAPLRLHGAGTEYYALREYRSGDPLTRIHWKATARHSRLVAREDTWERGNRLVILLDCGRSMTTLDSGRSKLDHALAAALALARVAASRGDKVAFVGVSDRVERVVRVRQGARGIAAAYGSLYDLEARLADPAWDLGVSEVSTLETRRATVVILTSIVDLAAADLLRQALVALARRHRPVLLNLEDPDLDHLARGVPETTAEAFAKVAAMEILLANRRLGRSLKRADIAVASAPADQLAWRTLEMALGSALQRIPVRDGGRA